MKLIALLAIVVSLDLWFAGNVVAAAALTTLHVFHDTDGHAPAGALVQGTNGHFYGTTSYGGTGTNCIDGCGTVFEITSGGEFTSLHSFTNYDGSAPRAGLVQASDGNLYGTTAGGGFFGPGGLGTVFRITPGGQLTMIHSFDIGGGGISPEGDLIEASDGSLYGTTSSGSVQGGVGGVFRITTNGVFSVLNGLNQPAAGVIQASDGNLYGTTQFGGTSTNCTYGCGSVFQVTLAGVVTTLHSFDGSDGKEPLAGLMQASDGVLYGTTSGGPFAALNCSDGCGTVFQITTNGEFTSLHAFSGPDGRQPRGGLVQGDDGTFYGTTFYGGLFGTVFQMTTNGVVTRLISFNGSNGGGPEGTLVQGSDGAFYGTTEVGGGLDGSGTIFKLTIRTNSSAIISCVLSPGLATNIVGATHTVVATVTSNGVARSGVLVNFSVTAGPNIGQRGTSTTSASGQGSFSYTGGTTPGVDTIRAVSLGAASTATNVWISPEGVGDGIPDSWRAQYFGGNGATTNSQSCATCDADGTGQNNLFKYIAGLNPTNSASVFTFSVQSVNGQPTRKKLIYSPIAAGRTYLAQFSTNLASGAWAPLTVLDGPTTNIDQATVTDLGAIETSKFYRILISLP